MMKKKIKCSILTLVLVLSGLVSCGPPVSAISIAMNVNKTISLMNTTMAIYSFYNEHINKSYKELEINISNKRFGVETLQHLESNYRIMQNCVTSYKDTISEVENVASDLFGMLYKRAKENKNDELKDGMLKDIEAKEEQFKNKIEIARGVEKNLEVSMQHYDDILGYLQVQGGLDNLDKHLLALDNAIIEGNKLNTEIEQALNEGMRLINGFGGG